MKAAAYTRAPDVVQIIDAEKPCSDGQRSFGACASRYPIWLALLALR